MLLLRDLRNALSLSRRFRVGLTQQFGGFFQDIFLQETKDFTLAVLHNYWLVFRYFWVLKIENLYQET